MKIKMKDGTRYAPKDSDLVECHEHGTKTTWGALDDIQKVAASEGLDTTPDLPCLLLPRK